MDSVGIRYSFPFWVSAYFQGLLLLVSGRVTVQWSHNETSGHGPYAALMWDGNKARLRLLKKKTCGGDMG